MATSDNRPDQREALSKSERNASREQPENFKPEETDDKVVEILPIDGSDGAIKGIDPDRQQAPG